MAYTDDFDKEARSPVPDIGANEFFSIPDFSLGPDQLICPGDTLAFHVGTVGYSAVWSNGETTQSVRLALPGSYWVEVYGPCGMVRDTFSLIPSTLMTFSKDQDGDGLGDPNNSMTVCQQPTGYLTNMNDCDDSDDSIGAAPLWYKDIDNDEYSNGTSQSQCVRPNNHKLASELLSMTIDCNDMNANIHPGANELCNGLDDNCDGNIDEGIIVVTWYPDADGDGFGDGSMSMDSCGQPVGYVNNNDDCDDTDNQVTLSKTWYKDFDNDGFTDSMTVNQCMRPPFYKLGTELVGVAKDCNDLDPDIYPGAIETCNGKDDNCDGNIDEGVGPLVLLNPDYIYGDRIVCPSIGLYEYYINPVISATNYEWTYSGSIISITVMDNLVSLEFDNSSSAGFLSVTASGICASTTPISLYVTLGVASQCNYSKCAFSKIVINNGLLQSTGVLYFKAQNFIYSPAQLNQGLQYKFQAGSSIELQPGFEVSNLTVLDLNIGSCKDYLSNAINNN